MSDSLKLIRITTVPSSLRILLKGQPTFFKENGFEVILMTSNGVEVNELKSIKGIDVIIVPLTRRLTPIADLYSLLRLLFLFYKIRPKIVHTHTPKAGTIGMIASKLARVPIRLHTVAGLPLMEKTGLLKFILKKVERLTSKSATKIFPNSVGLRDYMLANGLVRPEKQKIIGFGSSNGIDTSYYSKSRINSHELAMLRKDLDFDSSDFVFCYVGRIVSDKGINELLISFDNLSKIHSNLKLLIVGRKETDLDPLSSRSNEILKNNNNVVSTGWRDDVRPYLGISDVFVFPSYREGFPNAVLQAASMELPCIVTNINGCNEIIEDGVGGILVEKKNVSSLSEAMEKLYIDDSLRETIVKNTRSLIKKKFERSYVWNQLLDEYRTQLIDHGILMED